MTINLLIWGGILVGGIGLLTPYRWLAPVAFIVAGVVGLVTTVGL